MVLHTHHTNHSGWHGKRKLAKDTDHHDRSLLHYHVHLA